MAKLPWMKFFPADFLLDTQLLTTPARGVWIDLICHLWRSQTRGSMTLSANLWNVLLRTEEPERVRVFEELKRNGICNIVTGSDEHVTVESRRIVKEETARTGAAKRMRSYRDRRNSDASVTGEKLEARSQKLEARSQKEEKKPSRATDDVTWIEELKTNPAYTHINFPVELGKMDAWLALPQNKNRVKTRRFILNWLNKIERPMNGTHTTLACQYRVQRGNFLKPCGAAAIATVGGRPLCKEHHVE